MESAKAHPLPAGDPFSGGPLVVTELQNVESGITIRGRFEIPRFARLSPDQTRFLETFLRCRGMLNSVERELGISYPTARARLDAVLRTLDLVPGREDDPEPPEASEPPRAPAPQEAPPVPPGEVGSTVEEPPAPPNGPEAPKRSKMEILDAIERGEISAEDAKRELGNAQ